MQNMHMLGQHGTVFGQLQCCKEKDCHIFCVRDGRCFAGPFQQGCCFLDEYPTGVL